MIKQAIAKYKNNNYSNLNITDEDRKIIRNQMLEDNHKAASTWACCGIIYWIYCLFMTTRKEDYRMCYNAYIIGLILCIIALLLNTTLTKKENENKNSRLV